MFKVEWSWLPAVGVELPEGWRAQMPEWRSARTTIQTNVEAASRSHNGAPGVVAGVCEGSCGDGRLVCSGLNPVTLNCVGAELNGCDSCEPTTFNGEPSHQARPASSGVWQGKRSARGKGRRGSTSGTNSTANQLHTCAATSAASYAPSRRDRPLVRSAARPLIVVLASEVVVLACYLPAGLIVRDQVHAQLASVGDDRTVMLDAWAERQEERAELAASRMRFRRYLAENAHGDVSNREFTIGARRALHHSRFRSDNRCRRRRNDCRVDQSGARGSVRCRHHGIYVGPVDFIVR